MLIYGVALLSFSYLIGQWLGELLGKLIGINSNVGGVGFAMIILMLLKELFERKGWWKHEMISGIDFWNKLYIPVVIAMAASLNVKAAISSGNLAIVVGIIPVIFAFLFFPFLMKTFKQN
ncbi:malonate transporter subunit MadL [Algoriphagus persicinus]|uniref:malonate transporter subunit MadL n=1 Tax=Algoriphagus persicinus TaxID=3108754 RepID=UPI002B3BA670|nr:malonate transporter subunit MadL [Algoriphagus sp. E1-3-M2]MEB2784049.1 malonate transporter subunit MadL [Algoriphagus sp. E1-3-M2]